MSCVSLPDGESASKSWKPIHNEALVPLQDDHPRRNGREHGWVAIPGHSPAEPNGLWLATRSLVATSDDDYQQLFTRLVGYPRSRCAIAESSDCLAEGLAVNEYVSPILDEPESLFK